MKATGIVRRIDELGRVVIPKEIRRTLRIREGDPLEIFTDRDGEVILKKYSPIGELGDFAKEYAESLYQALGHTAVMRLMKTRERGTFSRAQGNMIPLFSGDNGVYQSGVVVPILAGGDAIGAVLMISREVETMGEVERKLCETAAHFMGKQMET